MAAPIIATEKVADCYHHDTVPLHILAIGVRTLLKNQPYGSKAQVMMALGDRLRRARIEAALTQQRVAELANVERNTIWRYEAEVHEPSASILNVLAAIYGKPVAWFWEEDEINVTSLGDNDLSDQDLEADRELLMSEVDLAFRQVAPELSDEAIRSIAAFIRFTHAEEERERREQEGPG